MTTHSESRRSEAAVIRGVGPSEDDPHSDVRGVLLSDEIIYYATNHHLITPFNRSNLKPAAYELTVGDEYFLSGKFSRLDEAGDGSKVTIHPFEVAVLKTAEVLRIPRYMIARWNIRVRHAYSGLLWVGAPQVDPGWVGHLYCPIYNLSDKPVTLNVGDPLAVMDFVKTTPFDIEKSQRANSDLIMYPFPPKRLFLEDYGIDDLRSALFTKAGEKLGEFEENIRNLESRFITFTQLSFAIFAVVIALIVTLSKAGNELFTLSASVYGSVTLAVSICAFLVAIFSYMHWRVGRLIQEQYGRLMASRTRTVAQYVRRAWYLGFCLCLTASVLGGLGLYYLTAPFFDELRKSHVLVKSDLDGLGALITGRIDRLSNRLQTVERATYLTPADLEKLRIELEQKIQSVRPTEPRPNQ